MSNEGVITQDQKVRIQLDFTREAVKELDILQTAMRTSSRAQVIRDSLGVLRWVVNNLKEDNTILVEKKNGEKVRIEFPFFVHH